MINVERPAIEILLLIFSSTPLKLKLELSFLLEEGPYVESYFSKKMVLVQLETMKFGPYEGVGVGVKTFSF